MTEKYVLLGEEQGQLLALNSYFEEKCGEAYSYELVDRLGDSIYVWKEYLKES